MTDLADRYGTRTSPRWIWWVVAGVGIAVGMAWAAWIALQPRPVSTEVYSFEAVSDTRILSAKADVTVFLARWRKTPEKAILAALKTLDQAGAHVSGLALTQVDMVAQAKYGYGDAGYYYSSYKKYYAA